jgi:hypothetical protein
MRRKIYAAYGSNLNVAQMSYRCPEATRLHTAVLEGYELVFRGNRYHAVATIEPKEGSSVPIMLWSIGKKDEKALDHYEGYPSFYGKETMTFDVGGQKVKAMVYVMTPGHQLGTPSVGYYSTIRQGYKDCGLDVAVLDRAVQHSLELVGHEPPSLGELRMW